MRPTRPVGGPWVPLLLLALTAGVGWADDGARPDAPPDRDESKNRIVIGIQQEPDLLHPMFMEMVASIEVSGDFKRSGPLFAGLTIRGADWVLRPWLAEALPSRADGTWTVDEEKKTMVTRWKIRKDAAWEDGVPITADDFIFALQVKLDPQVPVIDNTMEKRISAMKAEGEDRKTLVVEWKELYAGADEGHDLLPRHIEEPVYTKAKDRYRETPFGRKPVGNGPYRLKEWVSGQHLILERNPKWWGPPTRLERIVYRVISDTNTLVATLQAGELDAISPVGISFDQALELEKNPVKGFRVTFTPGLVWEHVDFKTDSPILSDKRVRHALQFATDRDKIVKEYFEGRQEAAHSWLPPKHYGYNADVKRYTYDPKKAAALLEEAGWKKGADGVRVNAQGEPLALTLMTTAGNKVRENIQQILQSMWKKVGVKLEIRNQEANVFFGETVRYRKFPHMVMYAWTMSPTSDGESLWTSGNIPSEKNGWIGQNGPGYSNPESDAIDHKVPVTLDAGERAALLRRQQEIWVEELPCLLLYFRSDVTVVRDTLRHWQPTGTDTGVTWNCQDWYLAR